MTRAVGPQQVPAPAKLRADIIGRKAIHQEKRHGDMPPPPAHPEAPVAVAAMYVRRVVIDPIVHKPEPEPDRIAEFDAARLPGSAAIAKNTVGRKRVKPVRSEER